MANILAKKQGKTKLPVTYWVLLSVILLLCIFAAGSVAKYIRATSSDGSVKASWFYFTSDLLDGEEHKLDPGTTSFSFTLGNNADNLRFSDMAVYYDVTVKDGNGEEVYKGSNNTGLTKEQKSVDTVTIGSTDNPLAAGTYTVTATGYSKAGEERSYQKTLTGTFVIPPVESAVYKYLDTSNSDYVLLTVWAQNYTGDVTISYPATVTADNTDGIMRSVYSNNNSFTDATTFQSNNYASHVYRFFGSSVTVDEFTVTYGDGNSASVKAPS